MTAVSRRELALLPLGLILCAAAASPPRLAAVGPVTAVDHVESASQPRTDPPPASLYHELQKYQKPEIADRLVRTWEQMAKEGVPIGYESFIQGTVIAAASGGKVRFPVPKFNNLQDAQMVLDFMKPMLGDLETVNTPGRKHNHAEDRPVGDTPTGTGLEAVKDHLTAAATGDTGPTVLPGPGTQVREQILTGVVTQFPNSPMGYTGLAQIRVGAGDNAGAYDILSKGIKRTGGTSDLYFLRGQAAKQLGDTEQANRDAAEALSLDPENSAANALYQLTKGRVSSLKLEKPDFGAKAGSGRESAGRSGNAADGRGTSLGDGRAADMEPEAGAAGGPEAQQSESFTQAARTALMVRDTESAIGKATKAIELNPANAQAYNLRATAYLQRKDYAAAVRDASAGLGLAPGSVPLLNTRAMALNRLRDFSEGFRDAAAAIGLQPQSAAGYVNRAHSESGLDRRGEMLEDLRRAAELDPKFREKYEAAVRLPEDSDTALLFDDLVGAGGAAAAAEASARRSLPLWPFALAGLLLVGFGVFSSPGIRERTTQFFSRAPADVRSAPAAEPGAPPSAFWGRYEVRREIAEGGMGVVYEAFDRGLERRVAVKKMRDEIRLNRRERERFLNEARTVAKLHHPNIVEIYSIEEDGDDAYLVFEYVEGRTLHEIIQEQGRLSLAPVKHVFLGVCSALEYAHGQGVVHRDLKPANIMVDKNGAVKVMDFGVARQAADAAGNHNQTNTVIGTLPYMAPEQEEGVVRREADIYALGVCLYEALSGDLPFKGSPGAALLSKRDAKYAPLGRSIGGLPEAVDRLIGRALQPDPEQRIHSAREFFQELDHAPNS